MLCAGVCVRMSMCTNVCVIFIKCHTCTRSFMSECIVQLHVNMCMHVHMCGCRGIAGREDTVYALVFPMAFRNVCRPVTSRGAGGSS